MADDPEGSIRAVLWDFGGVISTSPFEGFARYEADAGLPAGFLRRVNSTDPDDNAWARLERGEPVASDLMTGLLARGQLARAPGGTVLYDLRSSWATAEEIRAAGGRPEMCRVGHSFVKAQMRETGAVFAGELSGHFYFRFSDRLVADDGELFPMKPEWAKNVITALARIGGHPVGFVASQPKVLGGTLDVNSADKAARFVWLCDAFNIPLVFLADVPGFMIGSKVEREGIIRHGAKLITAVSEATVPKFCVVVRKAYGAGLYAMAGPGFEPDATLALPTARIAVMGPEPAVNAVFYNKIQEIADPRERDSFVEERRRQYEADIDILHLASENVVDAVVQPDDLRAELVRRLRQAAGKEREFSGRRHGVPPV